LTKTHGIARRTEFKESDVCGQNVEKNCLKPNFARHVIAEQKPKCPNCDALLWIEERLANSTVKKPKFGICCKQGCISLPKNKELPATYLELLTSENKESVDFSTYIRLYNSVLGFASTSANVDQALMQATSGVYNYRINGGVHHKISAFLPNDNKKETFSQFYVLDPLLQSTARTGMFPGIIKANILNKIQDVLQIHNPYVQIYKQAGELWRSDPSKEFNIILKDNYAKDKTKSVQAVNEIAVLMVEDDQTSTSTRDVVIHKRNTNELEPFIFINQNLAISDPLAFPLLHIYGEGGWQFQTIVRQMKSKRDRLINIELSQQPIENFNEGDYPTANLNETSDNSLNDINIDGIQTKNVKYVTCRDYYCYKLFERTSKI
jgi:hypothetical protein